jgi:hypothetical protein
VAELVKPIRIRADPVSPGAEDRAYDEMDPALLGMVSQYPKWKYDSGCVNLVQNLDAIQMPLLANAEMHSLRHVRVRLVPAARR